MIRALLPIFALGLVSACAIQPLYRQSDAPLPVADVALDRYLGLWHEAARLPNWFERDCSDVTAEYSRREDGLISVVNTCHGGRPRTAEGRAKRVGEGEEGKFKVSFFGPFFFGDYWVLERADDYSWAIVGEPRGRYLWILTRVDEVSSEQRAFLEARISALGYRPSDLVWDEG